MGTTGSCLLPKPRLTQYSIAEDTLARVRTLRYKHGLEPSDLLEARLAYAKANQILSHYVKPMAGCGRIFPRVLPTQTSGRWSTTEPPLVNFPGNPEAGFGPYGIRDVVWPDPGWYWLSFDWSAIESRIWSAMAGETADLEAFDAGWDVHTITACDVVFRLPRPSNLHNPHAAPEDAGWREAVHWQGKEDRRRHIAKTLRYALAYSKRPEAVFSARGVEQLGVTRNELLAAARAYLAGKPLSMAAKRRIWAECWRTHQSRTILGRRRLLFGPQNVQEKEGLNHQVQGLVADMMNLVIIAYHHEYPGSHLVLNKHDGLDWAFPETLEVPQVWRTLRPIVERPLEINGYRVAFPADWSVTQSDGKRMPYSDLDPSTVLGGPQSLARLQSP